MMFVQSLLVVVLLGYGAAQTNTETTKTEGTVPDTISSPENMQFQNPMVETVGTLTQEEHQNKILENKVKMLIQKAHAQEQAQTQPQASPISLTDSQLQEANYEFSDKELNQKIAKYKVQQSELNGLLLDITKKLDSSFDLSANDTRSLQELKIDVDNKLIELAAKIRQATDLQTLQTTEEQKRQLVQMISASGTAERPQMSPFAFDPTSNVGSQPFDSTSNAGRLQFDPTGNAGRIQIDPRRHVGRQHTDIQNVIKRANEVARQQADLSSLSPQVGAPAIGAPAVVSQQTIEGMQQNLQFDQAIRAMQDQASYQQFLQNQATPVATSITDPSQIRRDLLRSNALSMSNRGFPETPTITTNVVTGQVSSTPDLWSLGSQPLNNVPLTFPPATLKTPQPPVSSLGGLNVLQNAHTFALPQTTLEPSRVSETSFRGLNFLQNTPQVTQTSVPTSWNGGFLSSSDLLTNAVASTPTLSFPTTDTISSPSQTAIPHSLVNFPFSTGGTQAINLNPPPMNTFVQSNIQASNPTLFSNFETPYRQSFELQPNNQNQLLQSTFNNHATEILPHSPFRFQTSNQFVEPNMFFNRQFDSQNWIQNNPITNNQAQIQSFTFPQPNMAPAFPFLGNFQNSQFLNSVFNTVPQQAQTQLALDQLPIIQTPGQYQTSFAQHVPWNNQLIPNSNQAQFNVPSFFNQQTFNQQRPFF